MAVLASTVVGMAEIEIIKGQGILSCLGLGSCIGLCALDAQAGVAGMAHIMLPEAFADKPVDRPGKFANTGVPALIQLLEEAGASKNRLVFAMAGGARVFKFSAGTHSRMDIGARNNIAVLESLKKLNFRLRGTETGGNLGRTLTFNVETGLIRVRTISQAERDLCNLRG